MTNIIAFPGRQKPAKRAARPRKPELWRLDVMLPPDIYTAVAEFIYSAQREAAL